MVKKMYCVKCRHKTDCHDIIEETDRVGKPRYHGICKHCGTHCYQYYSLKNVNNMNNRRFSY